MKAQLDAIIHALTTDRYFVSDTLISKDLTYALLDEASSALLQGQFQEAGIGKGLTQKRDDSIRGDSTLWWSDRPQSEAQIEYLQFMQQLMDALNPIFYLGARRFEGHFARYETGAFYKKHVDQHQGVGARRLSTILYLSDFEAQDGGELVLYDQVDQDREIARVTPKLGRLVLFISADFPHEVLPTYKSRLSVTGWLRAQ